MRAITHLIGLLFFMSASQGLTADSSWLEKPPKQWNGENDGVLLDESMVSEIVHSKVDYALSLVSKATCVEVSTNQVELLLGRQWALKNGNHYVLIRSQFGHGATGAYTVLVSDDGTKVLVIHLSLGMPVPTTPSALLLQVEKIPSRLFSSVSFAR
jgi:hypothetical protein